MVRELLPLAAVVTPNAPEAEALTGRPVRTEAEAREAARRLHDLGPRAVIVKGGHLETVDVVDVLFDGQRLPRGARSAHATRHTHGTGCTFAAAIAAHLASDTRCPRRSTCPVPTWTAPSATLRASAVAQGLSTTSGT